MEKSLIFHILGIPEDSDESAVKIAYRNLLKNTNPEDDPEGFKRLREAYEAANAYADRPEELKKAPGFGSQSKKNTKKKPRLICGLTGLIRCTKTSVSAPKQLYGRKFYQTLSVRTWTPPFRLGKP